MNSKTRCLLRAILIIGSLWLIWAASEALYFMRPEKMRSYVIVRLDEGEHQVNFAVSRGPYAVRIVELTDSGAWRRIDSSMSSGIKGHLVISDPESRTTLVEASFEYSKSFRVPRRNAYRKLEMNISVELPDPEANSVYLQMASAI